MKDRERRRRLITDVIGTPFLLCLVGLFVLLLSWNGVWKFLLSPFFPDLDDFLYSRVSLWRLTVDHLILVLLSSSLSITTGVGVGILVTRSFGRDFLPVVTSLSSIAQTFPPVAVLALAVPVLGFGFKPTLLALFLYGVMPVLHNTITGLQGVHPEIEEAATGMGMSEQQRLWRVEMPLALPVILSGIRISVILNIGTATIGATIGAGGLGVPIITGLSSDNPAYIIQGSVIAALLAILFSNLLELLERRFTLPH